MPTNEEYKNLCLLINEHLRKEREELGYTGWVLRTADDKYIPLLEGDARPNEDGALVALICSAGIAPTEGSFPEEVRGMISAYRGRFGSFPNVQCKCGDHFVSPEELMITARHSAICGQCLGEEFKAAREKFEEDLLSLKPIGPLFEEPKRTIPLT